MKVLKFLMLVVVCQIVMVQSLDNGLALTPPMGFMTWQRYKCTIDCNLYPSECISEQLVKNIAKLMVEEGYLAVGYEYLIIDDCWASFERDKNGRLQPNATRFPSGISALSDYVHKLGLKFGMYADFGTYTCAGYPGSVNHLKLDAQTFADWKIDFIKFDGCSSELTDMEDGYVKFGQYLNRTGRQIMYSCSWPFYYEIQYKKVNYTKVMETCNLWRSWHDIEDTWIDLKDILMWYGNNQNRISNFSGAGRWNDPDMLIVGSFGLSFYQSQVHMALWSIMAAPLLMSVDLESIQTQYKCILQNKDAIAINQDSLGIMGRRVFKNDDIQIWTKPVMPIINNTQRSYAIAFINFGKKGFPYHLRINLDTVGLPTNNSYKVNIIFGHFDQEVINNGFISARIIPSGIVFMKLTPILDEL